MKSLPWLLLVLPVVTLLLIWDYLPARLPIHSSGGRPDRWGSREDFGGLVVAVTDMFALVSYIVLQVASSFQPMAEKERHKAYLAIAGGSSLMGFAIILAGLLTAK